MRAEVGVGVGEACVLQVSADAGGMPHKSDGTVAKEEELTQVMVLVFSPPPQVTGQSDHSPSSHWSPKSFWPAQSQYPHMPGRVV